MVEPDECCDCCDCCGYIVSNPNNLRWFDMSIIGWDTGSGIYRIRRECVIRRGGNWEEGVELFDENDHSDLYSDSDDDYYSETDDSDSDGDMLLQDYHGGCICDDVGDVGLGIICSHDACHETDRIKNNLIHLKAYDFSTYTTDTYNQHCYKYGLKMIGES